MAEHLCHAVGCEIPVQPKMHMCLSHWRMVPKGVQDLIWKHYRPGQEIDKRPTIEYIATAFVSVSCVALKEGKPLPSFIQVRHDVSFWPEGLFGKPAEKTECYSIEIGWPKTVYQFSGSTFQECVAQARAELDINLREDETCAECNYGAIDNLGLCVMDSTHQALLQAQ